MALKFRISSRLRLSNWIKVGDRRASGILNGQLSTSGYFGFSFTLRYRAISTTVFLRFTDLNLRNFWRTAFVASWIFVGNRFPTLFDGRISLLRGHSSAINGFPTQSTSPDFFASSIGFIGDHLVSDTSRTTVLISTSTFGFALSSFVAFEFSRIFRLAAVLSRQKLPRLVVS